MSPTVKWGLIAAVGVLLAAKLIDRATRPGQVRATAKIEDSEVVVTAWTKQGDTVTAAGRTVLANDKAVAFIKVPALSFDAGTNRLDVVVSRSSLLGTRTASDVVEFERPAQKVSFELWSRVSGTTLELQVLTARENAVTFEGAKLAWVDDTSPGLRVVPGWFSAKLDISKQLQALPVECLTERGRERLERSGRAIKVPDAPLGELIVEGGDSERIVQPVELTLDTGAVKVDRRSQVAVTLGACIGLLAKWNAQNGIPVASPHHPKAARRPTLVLPDIALPAPFTLGELELIADAKVRWKQVSACRYRPERGGVAFTVRVTRAVLEMTLREAQTGAVVATGSVEGDDPRCPSKTSDNEIQGRVPSLDVLSGWAKKYAGR